MIDRRQFTRGAAALYAAVTLPAWAQPAPRVYRMGQLRPTAENPIDAGIPLAMRELGYVEGQNLILDRRYADGHIDRLPALARELVALRPDVIVAVGSGAVRALKDATTTIPIVLYGNFDPVALGLVASLARPGSNVTGTLIAPEGTLAAKKLELLKEAVPRATRFALLSHDDPNFRMQAKEVQQAASSLGIKLAVVEVRGGDYDRAFATLAAERPEALFVGANTYFMRDRKRIIEFAAKLRLPAIYEWPEQVIDGGLMSYGGSLAGAHQRVANYVDRILKGAQPAELPIEQPTKLRLVINIGTAKALGLTIPQSLLLRADEVVQ